MALDTYSNLKTAISDWLDRDDMSSHIDDFIDIAEARHKREIRIREMQDRASITIDARQVSLPTGFLEMQSLKLLTDPVTVLTEVSINEMDKLRSETTGKPTYFTIHEALEFDKTPDSSYSGEIISYSELTALSDANTSNALLTRAPDCYLYGALSAAAPFLLDDERIQVWETLYAQARDGLMLADRKSRHAGPIYSRPVGAMP